MLNGLMAIKVTTSRPVSTFLGEFGPTGLTALSTAVIKTPDEGVRLGRMVLRPSGRVQRLVEPVPRRIEDIREEKKKHLTKSLFVVFFPSNPINFI